MYKFLIVGLGNPGKIYQNTRHNIGALIADQYISPIANNIAIQHNCIIDVMSSISTMNISGIALFNICQNKQYNKIIILFDDMETKLGHIKVSYPTMGHKGHNGVRDIIKYFKNDFHSIKIGIGRPPNNIPVNEFVLNNFTIKELNDILTNTSIIQQYIIYTIEHYINNQQKENIN